MQDEAVRKSNTERPLEDYVVDKISNREIVEETFPKLTDIEAGVAIYLMYGFTGDEIIKHFEFSRQRYSQIKQHIRAKFEQQMKEWEDKEANE